MLAGSDDRAAPARPPSCPAAPLRARPAPPRTTATRGSSGFTPQLVAAVWVGYPDKLVPMTYQFHGGPVAGGTFPALIWKAFMTKALAYMKANPEDFPAPPSQYAAPVTVVNRGGALERDNGVCHNSYQLEFFGGEPLFDGHAARSATCKPNEVEIPDMVGASLADAKTRLEGQPLTPAVVYEPAKPGDRVGYVVGQIPAAGHRFCLRQDRADREEVAARRRPERRRAFGSRGAQARLAKANLTVK